MRFAFHPVTDAVLEIRTDTGAVRQVTVNDLDALAGVELPREYPGMTELGRRVYEFLNWPE